MGRIACVAVLCNGAVVSCVFWVVAGGIFGAAVGAKNAPTKHQDQYTIVITSTSGEIEALTTADKAQADAVVRALDQAIGDQSRNF